MGKSASDEISVEFCLTFMNSMEDRRRKIQGTDPGFFKTWKPVPDARLMTLLIEPQASGGLFQIS
jgi:hypothetical protein